MRQRHPGAMIRRKVMKLLFRAALLVSLPATAALAAPPGYVDVIGTARLNVMVLPPANFEVRLPKFDVLSALTDPAAAAAKAGQELLEKFSIADPSLLLRDAFVQGLREKHKLDLGLAVGISSEDPKELKKKLGNGYGLDFKTVVWALNVFGSGDSDHFRVEYWARVRLIHLDSERVLWQATCKFTGPAPKGARPALAELLKDNAALLKARLAEAAKSCTSELLPRFDPEPKQP